MAGQDASRDERTEEATPRKREEARDRGQVAMSQELVSALMLCATTVALAVAGSSLAEAAGGLTVNVTGLLREIGTGELEAREAAGLVREAVVSILWPLVMVMLPVLAIGLTVGYGQAGFRIAPKALEPRPDKLDPIKGFGRILGARGWIRFLLSVLKISLIGAAVSAAIMLQLGRVGSLAGNDLGPSLLGGFTVVGTAVGCGLAAFLLIAVLDVVFQRQQHDRDLRMTKQEVKEDHKNTEGDPHVRARVRQLQREMAMNRMMADVPKATVVVTNPTHIAVALLYERDENGAPLQAAPRVLAKGADLIAQKIKEIAREAGVPLHEDVPLARALFARSEVGRDIPEELYAAVATVIGYVYRLREARAAR